MPENKSDTVFVDYAGVEWSADDLNSAIRLLKGLAKDLEHIGWYR